MSSPDKLDWTKTGMQYRHLGRSGLKVSAISLGTWTTYGGSTEDDTAYECMTVALKVVKINGVNFFDNAEAYISGKSEISMGKILQRWFAQGLCIRSDLVLSTKIFFGAGLAGVVGNPNAVGLSRKHIMEAIDGSLARLQLSYVDIVFCHRPDPLTPIEETVRAMNQIIADGKAFYWGTSEWSASEIARAYDIAAKLNLIGPTAEQPQYNLVCRKRFESEYQPIFVQYGLGSTIWSPIAGGLLSGKYSPGVIPDGSRLSHAQNAFLLNRLNSGDVGDVKGTDIFAKVDTLKPIADRLGCTLAVLSVAWCLKNPNVSTVLTGASKPEQVVENLKALQVADKLTPEVLAEIDAAIGTKPAAAFDFGRGVNRIF